MPSVVILISIVGAILFAGLAARRTVAVRKALQPFLPLELRGISLMRLDNWVWDPLVPVRAKRDYLLGAVHGSIGGALLTLALVAGGWNGPALFTGIATAAGIIRVFVAAVRYRKAIAVASRM